MICAAFYLALTATVTNATTTTVVMPRDTWAKVEATISDAIKGSPNLMRVRVYLTEPKMQKSGEAPFSPLIDWWIR